MSLHQSYFNQLIFSITTVLQTFMYFNVESSRYFEKVPRTDDITKTADLGPLVFNTYDWYCEYSRKWGHNKKLFPTVTSHTFVQNWRWV